MNKIRSILMIMIIGITAAIGGSLARAESYPHDPALNDPNYWESFLPAEMCLKTEDPGTPYTVKSYEGWVISAVILKAGAKDGANEVFRGVEPGDVLSHSTGKDISHVIVCKNKAVPPLEPSEEPSEEPSVTPSPSPTPTETPSETPSVSPSPTSTETPSETPPPSETPSVTPSPSVSPSETPPVTPTATPSLKPSPTPSPTPPPSETPTQAPSVAPTPSATSSPPGTPTSPPGAVPTPQDTWSASSTRTAVEVAPGLPHAGD